MTDSDADGWAWFEPAVDASGDSALPDVFVRAFASDAGRQVLSHLRRATIERRLPPDAPESLLRFVEGQRSLVARIESLATPKPQ
ncbi:MAG: hypothetical protein H6844_05585 [Alphaproteobacteria bacterium]|nr:hypothetical protein [Geminicoccaceae bacterium]MCB9928871.1 hypothetical protein [Alphaproteobacteria bacterium]